MSGYFKKADPEKVAVKIDWGGLDQTVGEKLRDALLAGAAQCAPIQRSALVKVGRISAFGGFPTVELMVTKLDKNGKPIDEEKSIYMQTGDELVITYELAGNPDGIPY